MAKHGGWGKVLTWAVKDVVKQFHQHKKTPCFLVMCKNEKEMLHPASAFQVDGILLTHEKRQEKEKNEIQTMSISVLEYKMEKIECKFLFFRPDQTLPIHQLEKMSTNQQIIFMADRWLTMPFGDDHRTFLQKTQHLPLVFLMTLNEVFKTQLQKLIFF